MDVSDMTPEQKLANLRSEMYTPIHAVLGFTNVMQKYFSENEIQGLPEDFDLWLRYISEGAEAVFNVLQEYTKPTP
jgi:hypothetical protein